jgi:hypothetical protein
MKNGHRLENLKRASLFTLSLALFAGCSERWIESDAGFTGDEVVEQIAQIQASAGPGVNSSALQSFNSLVESPTSYIYYVDGPSPMGTALSAASLIQFNIVGRPDVSDLDLSNAIVVYVEDLTTVGLKSALLIQIQVKGESQPVTRVFESIQAPSVKGGQYETLLGSGNTHQLTLRSFYVSDDELQSVVQFEVFEVRSGIETWVGKFGAMVGYGG